MRRRSFLGALATVPLVGQAPTPVFQEIPPEKSGIHWVHDSARSPQRYMPEAIGPGCAVFDFDNDGWMDLFFVNSGPSVFYQPKTAPQHALYKNNRDGTFSNVTGKSGIAANFFGMGCAVGDFDNDGWPDLLVTGYSRVALYKNNRNGSFTDITEQAGLGPAKLISNWTTSAAWFDSTGSGRLDLFLCAYVDFGSKPPFASCGDNRLGRNFYCVPRVFKGMASMLFLNNGDGTFTYASAGTPIAESLGKALGVVATDINNDGRMDLFVANDTVQNFLFVNRGKGPRGLPQWEEIGLASEVGYGENGQARSGMGADAADFDQDGWEDLFVTNIDQEMYSLYRNNKDETFTDIAHRQGVAQATRMMSGWGLKFFDYDNDGNLDLLLANSHPDDMIEQYSENIKYAMPPQLFHQENGRLRLLSPAEAGAVFGRPLTARGLALGDLWNRGRLDALIANNGAAPVLLRNEAGAGNHWLGVRLVGKTANRDAIGARIAWKGTDPKTGDKVRRRLKTSGGSYLSSHDPREILGLGGASTCEYVEVAWPQPSTRRERFPGLAADAYHVLEEGKGVEVK
ncbi:MAG: CRTAC1 family protein [Bryobacter sp.]|nr:CRTAC1 family protein [Bryobacter sp.]